MKYLKTYEENNNIQQPFYLTKGDTLYISDDLAISIVPTLSDKKNTDYHNFVYQKNENFLKHIKKEWSGKFGAIYNTYVSSYASTGISVRWKNNYKMDILLYRSNRNGFQYYIGGISGDSEMHGKNMIRATKECNLNFMIKLYPIVKYIKNFYKRLYNEKFLDIIKDAIDEDITLVQYGIPKEIKYMFDTDIEDAVKKSFKYNL